MGSRSHFTLTKERLCARANNRRDEKKTLCAHYLLLKYLIEMQCKRNVGVLPVIRLLFITSIVLQRSNMNIKMFARIAR